MVKEPKLVKFKNEKKKACWKRVETDVTKTGNRKGWWKIGTKHNLKPSPISSFVSNSLLCFHYSFPSSPSSLLVPVPRFSKNPCWNASNLFFPKSTSKSAENYLQTILAFLIYKRKIWKSNKARRAASRHKDYQLPECKKKKKKKKRVGWLRKCDNRELGLHLQNNNFARALRIFVHFFAFPTQVVELRKTPSRR